MGLPVIAADTVTIDDAILTTSDYIYNTVQNPLIGSIGGEWAIWGLARSEAVIPESYYQSYYKNVENLVKDSGGILHDKKYTEYSRVIIALTAIGKNPENVAGYNLLLPCLIMIKQFGKV